MYEVAYIENEKVIVLWLLFHFYLIVLLVFDVVIEISWEKLHAETHNTIAWLDLG